MATSQARGSVGPSAICFSQRQRRKAVERRSNRSNALVKKTVYLTGFVPRLVFHRSNDIRQSCQWFGADRAARRNALHVPDVLLLMRKTDWRARQAENRLKQPSVQPKRLSEPKSMSLSWPGSHTEHAHPRQVSVSQFDCKWQGCYRRKCCTLWQKCCDHLFAFHPTTFPSWTAQCNKFCPSKQAKQRPKQTTNAIIVFLNPRNDMIKPAE